MRKVILVGAVIVVALILAILDVTRARQLRAEIYNVTNTPSFQNPSGSLGSASFGSISNTGNAPPRQMQFAAKVLF
jgi:hypothetical protein